MRVVKKNCLYAVVKSKLLTKLRKRRIKQFEQGDSWAVKQLQYLFLYGRSFSGHWTSSLIWMSYVSYGFDLWRKIHPLFFVTILSLILWLQCNCCGVFLFGFGFFKLKDITKKRGRTKYLCQTDFFLLFVGIITGGKGVLSQSLFCCISVYLFTWLYHCIHCWG